MLNKTETKLVHKFWPKYPFGKISKIHPLKSGYRNQNYLVETVNGRKYALKIYARNFISNSTLENHCQITEKLRRQKTPITKTHKGVDGKFVQESQGRQVVCTHFVESALFSVNHINEKSLKHISKTLKSLHQKLRIIDNRAKHRILDLEEILNTMTKRNSSKFYPGYKKDLKDIRANMQTTGQTQLIHGDYRADNLNIISNKVETIFDFDELQLAPTTYELALSLVHLDEGYVSTEELVKIFLKNYKNSYSTKELEQIITFMKFRCIYRIYRWFTHSKDLKNPGMHYTHYLDKLERYKQLTPNKIRW